VEKGGGRASSIIKSALFTALRGMISTEIVEMEKINQNVGLYIYLLLYLAAQTQHPTAKSGKTAHPIRYKGQTQGVFKKGGGV
jgi:hypothetical protein